MLKTIVVVIVAAIPFMFSAGEARAQHKGAGGGVQCPVGSCGGNGGPGARDVKYCKPSNCKPGAPK
jgi:hypothetical protein